MSEELRGRLVRNFNEVELERFERAPLYEGRSARVIGPRIEGCAARDLGASVDVIPPGKMNCPYHFHYGEEEMFIIVEGEGTLRVAGERIPVRAGDIIDIPPGPEYPHHIINTSQAPLKYLSISTQKRPEVCEYPDSNKYLMMTGDNRGIVAGGRMHRAETDLDYWDGEP
jgi:uncharacterized cupin superfamily protein